MITRYKKRISAVNMSTNNDCSIDGANKNEKNESIKLNKKPRNSNKKVRNKNKSNESEISSSNDDISSDYNFSDEEDEEIRKTARDLLNYNPRKRKSSKNTKVSMREILCALSEINKNVKTTNDKIDQMSNSIKDISKRVTKVENFVSELKTNQTIMEEKYSKLEKRCEDLEANLKDMHKFYSTKIQNLTTEIDEVDQSHRNLQIILSYTPVNSTMSYRESVIECLHRKLMIPMDRLQNISVNKFTRFGSKFLVTLPNYDLKACIFKAAKEHKPQNIYINEFLTARRANIYHKFRLLKKNEHRFEAVYTYNGNVFVKENGQDRPTRIHPMNE